MAVLIAIMVVAYCACMLVVRWIFRRAERHWEQQHLNNWKWPK